MEPQMKYKTHRDVLTASYHRNRVYTLMKTDVCGFFEICLENSNPIKIWQDFLLLYLKTTLSIFMI